MTTHEKKSYPINSSKIRLVAKNTQKNDFQNQNRLFRFSKLVKNVIYAYFNKDLICEKFIKKLSL